MIPKNLGHFRANSQEKSKIKQRFSFQLNLFRINHYYLTKVRRLFCQIILINSELSTSSNILPIAPLYFQFLLVNRHQVMYFKNSRRSSNTHFIKFKNEVLKYHNIDVNLKVAIASKQSNVLLRSVYCRCKLQMIYYKTTPSYSLKLRSIDR